jgi:hypothetical protein
LYGPDKFLPNHEKSTPGAHVLIGVATNAGMFQPAELKGDDGKGRDHQVIIPFDAPTKLVIQSAVFQLADSTGKNLTNGRSESDVTVASGRPADQVKVKISGMK